MTVGMQKNKRVPSDASSDGCALAFSVAPSSLWGATAHWREEMAPLLRRLPLQRQGKRPSFQEHTRKSNVPIIPSRSMATSASSRRSYALPKRSTASSGNACDTSQRKGERIIGNRLRKLSSAQKTEECTATAKTMLSSPEKSSADREKTPMSLRRRDMRSAYGRRGGTMENTTHSLPMNWALIGMRHYRNTSGMERHARTSRRMDTQQSLMQLMPSCESTKGMEHRTSKFIPIGFLSCENVGPSSIATSSPFMHSIPIFPTSPASAASNSRHS